MNDIIKLKDVSMHFNICKEKITSAKEYFIKFLQKKIFYEDFVALEDITFNVARGDVLGIIGFNGSGKSTLLKIISGILKPTTGSVTVNGIVAPLIELGAGFDMELTARENIFLNGSVLGFNRQFIKDKFDEIVEFSEMKEFIDVPMKNYSSGMVARVGFSVATVVKPDVLIVDEILSVGDFRFQKKCENRIAQLMDGGTTVIIVSHSIEQIEQLCNRVLWLENSHIKMIGNSQTVCDLYKLQ